MIGYSWGKVKKTVSGWEKSHFGGFTRMITDYPYIKLDYNIKIELDESLTKDLMWYTADKLIKLYLLKLINLGIENKLSRTIVEIPNKFTGEAEKFVKIDLWNLDVMNIVLQHNRELAPLFEHYKTGIMRSHLLKKIDEDQDKGDGEGDGEGDSSDGDMQSSPKKSKVLDKAQEMEKMMSMLKEIKEHESFNSSKLSRYSGIPTFKPFHPNTSEYKFKQREIRDAENLLKMLDISFDPKSDVVKSLRAGKLDTCKIAEVAAGSTSIYKQTVEDQDTKPFGVCILADLSGSMTSGNRLEMQKHTMNVLYLALSQIVPEDKLWIYGHTGEDAPDIYPFYTPYDMNYASNITHYKDIDYCQNYDGPVIEAIHKKVRESCDDKIIFIVLSDGEPSGNWYGGEDDIADMKRILERARRDEFVTVSIGMQYMSIPGLYLYNRTVNDLNDLAKDVSQVVNKVVRVEFQ